MAKLTDLGHSLTGMAKRARWSRDDLSVLLREASDDAPPGAEADAPWLAGGEATLGAELAARDAAVAHLRRDADREREASARLRDELTTLQEFHRAQVDDAAKIKRDAEGVAA